MKSKLLALASGALLAACTASAASDAYKITADLPSDDFDGMMAYLIDFDTKAKVDSAAIDGAKVVFAGTVDHPFLARIMVNGRPASQLVVEPGEITTSRSATKGSPLNDLNTAVQTRTREFGSRFNALVRDSTYQAEAQKILVAYEAFTDSVFSANADNPVGYSIFLDKAYSMSLDELRAALDKYPALKKYQRVSNLLKAAVNKQATSPGKMFKDFTVKSDSTSQSLSDYVGKGKPVLVDFWASWCGPCIRETAVIKDLLNQYGPQGLEVLGVAVWDEPQNTRAAIEKHQLPWPQIINAQTIPTDIYGISAIPTILVVGPDGTILSRDKQDDELRDDVKAIMEGTLTPESLKAPADSTAVK